MPGKRILNQVSGEVGRCTGNSSKKRASRTSHGEMDNKKERDRRHLLNVFPEEIWLLCFEKLDNSADLESVSKSSLFFRELLSPQRTEFLFPNVCTELGEMVYAYEFLHEGDSPNPVTDPANYEEYIWQKVKDWCQEIVKLRLVCRHWSTVVEIFFENHPLHFRQEKWNRKENGAIREFLRENCILCNSQRSEQLLHHFAETHVNTSRNPFLGRSIAISIQDGNAHGFVDGILSVLWQYGSHVWYCSITINDFASGVDCYSRVEDLMRLMPNLKVLEVYVAEYGFTRRLSAMRLRELQSEINSRPLPTLQNLEMLTLSNLLPSIFLELIRRNAHVSILNVRREGSRYRYGIFKVALPNLKKIEISFYSEAAFLKMDRDLVDWPLTELHLNLENSSDFIEWQKVFNLLEKKFKNTLTELDLTLPVAVDKADKDRIYREGHTFKLNLPHVTDFSVKLGNLSCLDFMLPMKHSINYLGITIKLTDHENLIRPLEKVEAGSSRILKLLSCVRRPSESNLWTLFPKLEYMGYHVLSNESEIDCESLSRWNWNVNVKKRCK